MATVKTRREFLADAGSSVAALAALGFAPALARAAGAPFAVLSESQARTLEALGETLLPGARDAGIAHFVDAQLASPTPLLTLRYVDFPMPFVEFYAKGIAALDDLARARAAPSFDRLGADEQIQLVKTIATTNPAAWHGPPAPLFYFVTRSDAVDVCYGTIAGFAALEIPYMPHIAPARPW